MTVSRLGRHSLAKVGNRARCRLGLEALEDRCIPSVGYGQVNLASDIPGLAPTTDANLGGLVGMSASPTGPFWFSGRGEGVSPLLDGRGQVIPLVVNVPSPAAPQGMPAGIVFNPGAGFIVSGQGISASGQFIFAGIDGSISAWAPAVDPINAIVAQQGPAGASYTGLALVTDPAGENVLVAADFGLGTVDVFDNNYQPVTRAGAFNDPNLPEDYVPYNIQVVDHFLFVTYAIKGPGMAMYGMPGAGNGLIDVYDTEGNFVKRFATGGALNAPWGVALAPAEFGPLGGALLVANNGNGQINAYDPGSGDFRGVVTDDTGQPIAIPKLWALAFGNNHDSGASDTLFFTASSNDHDGLFGAIQPPTRRGADTGGAGRFDPSFPGERRDYPLPPSAGPAPQTSDEETAALSTRLLPLGESSLTFAPTLSHVSPTQAVAGTVAISPERPAATALLASGTLLVFSGEASQREGADLQPSAPRLSRLLDLYPQQANQAVQPGPSEGASPAAAGVIPPLASVRTPDQQARPTSSASAAEPAASASATDTSLTRTVQAVLPSSPPPLEASEPLVAPSANPWLRLLQSTVPVIGFALLWNLFERRRRRIRGSRRVALLAKSSLPSRLP
jgi:uncharacterized protein (TIGR03118 family)